MTKREQELFTQLKYEIIYSYNRKGNLIRLHLIKWQGSIKHMRAYTRLYDFAIKLFTENNVKFKTGNDAPRGGLIGEYIEFKLDFRNSFLRENFKELKQ